MRLWHKIILTPAAGRRWLASNKMRLLVGCCVLPFAMLAFGAEPLDYAIELQVPQSQRALLEDNLDLYHWKGSERMDETQLRRLLSRAPDQIREFLATEGFYSPKIATDLEQRNGKWVVKLEVDPGEPVRVTDIELRVTGAFEDGSDESRARLQKMREDWSLRRGDIFRHADWEAAKRGALKALLLDRYPAASITESRATVDPDKWTVTLEITLDSGPAFTLGALEIEGLERYPASIVERLNPIKPGEPYSQAKLLELQSRLQDSSYFSSASVTVETDPAKPERVPVRVVVTEAKSKKLGFGIGMSTDKGPRGQIVYRDYNFLDRAWRLSGTLKVEGKEQSLGGELQFPLTEEGYRESLTALLERTDIEGEVTRKFVLGAKRSRLRGKNETIYGIRYFLEQQDIQGAPGDSLSALVPSWSWIRRDVDNLLFPTRGYLINFQADGAAKALLSDQDFVRGYARGVYFYPFSPRDQLIARGEFGLVWAESRDGIPSDFLFRAGGDQSVRGYAYEILGVKEGDAIVGGRWLTTASLEYVHWLYPKWGAAAFFDTGDAADNFNDLKLVQGYGLGARWKSPVGPINLDVAYGRETEEVRLHFSVGFSF
jgi:translocation and assembly module TamA